MVTTTDAPRSFPERVSEAARLAGGVSVLAERTGLSRQVIGKYIRGESDPSRERLVLLADAAAVRVEWLAAGRGPVTGSETAPQLEQGCATGGAKDEFKAWLDTWWSFVGEKEHVWFEVEMSRTFPEFAEWQKKHGRDSSQRCGA